MKEFIVGNWFYVRTVKATSLADAIYNFLGSTATDFQLDKLTQDHDQEARVYGRPSEQSVLAKLGSLDGGVQKAHELAHLNGVEYFTYHPADSAVSL